MGGIVHRQRVESGASSRRFRSTEFPRLTAADHDAFVFSAPQGGPVRYATFRSRVWLPAVSEANVKGVTFHSLRHLAVTAMVVEGVDIHTAQHRLGHSDPRLLLNIYAHVSSDADRDAARRLGERFLTDEREVISNVREMRDGTGHRSGSEFAPAR